MLNTCSIIEIPPNPNKKAHITTLTAKFLFITADTATTPLVSSKSPVRIGIINSVLTPKILKQGIIN